MRLTEPHSSTEKAIFVDEIDLMVVWLENKKRE